MESIGDSIGGIAIKFSRQMRAFGLSDDQVQSSLRKVIREAAGDSPACPDLERRLLEETQKAYQGPSASMS